MPRFAIGSFFIECNHFGGPPADLESFRRSELLFGDDVLAQTSGTVGGMLATLRTAGATAVPLVVASACPSGFVTDDCYAQIKAELLDRLKITLPCDGVLLALHGSAAAESIGDLEGDLLAAVRGVVGEETPIVASLDHHAHVTAEMVQSADGLVAWDTYPHRDAYETGERAARMMLDIASGDLKPAMALAKVPVIVSGIYGHTEGPGPFADVMRRAKEMEREGGVYSTSAFLVHPYLDLPDMGGGGLVVTRGNRDLAESLAKELANLYWTRRFELEPTLVAPAEAVRRGLSIDGSPVLLVEASDCCGGGAAGDSAASLRALVESGANPVSILPLVDPPAAAACHAAGEGAELTLDLGHHVEPRWGKPLRVTGRVAKLSDGRFTYRGGIWGGREGNMGKSARFEIGNIQVGLASHATYEWCGEQFELLGMNARQAKFVVAKNPMNFNMAFLPFAKGCYILDTPGPTPVTLKHVQYKRLERPYFPADAEIPGIQPRICVNKARVFQSSHKDAKNLPSR